MARKYKGLGLAGWCIPEPSLSDKVTHGDMQAELQRLRAAVMILAGRSHDISTGDARRLMELLAPPEERPALLPGQGQHEGKTDGAPTLPPNSEKD